MSHHSVSTVPCNQREASSGNRTTPIWGLILLSTCACVWFPISGHIISAWFQPTLVGWLWGCQFLLGFWLAGSGRFSALNLILTGLTFGWLATAFGSLTDFKLVESIVLNALSFVSGWMLIRTHVSVARHHWSQVWRLPGGQITLLELMGVMTIVACVLTALPHFLTHLELTIGVFSTMIVCSGMSWTCYHWVWNDHQPVKIWSIRGLAIVVGSVGIILSASVTSEGNDSLTGMLQGPVNVIASQVILVLFAMGLTRSSYSVASRTDGQSMAESLSSKTI